MRLILLNAIIGIGTVFGFQDDYMDKKNYRNKVNRNLNSSEPVLKAAKIIVEELLLIPLIFSELLQQKKQIQQLIKDIEISKNLESELKEKITNLRLKIDKILISAPNPESFPDNEIQKLPMAHDLSLDFQNKPEKFDANHLNPLDIDENNSVFSSSIMDER